MPKVLFLACTVALAASVPVTRENLFVPNEVLSLSVHDPALIHAVNSAGTTWVAGVNDRFANSTLQEIASLCGSKLGGIRLPTKPETLSAASIPASFDARDQWKNCPSIAHIRDQSTCGSCWAFGAVEAMSDRICIATAAKMTVELSSQDMVSCCEDCGNGCNGGYPGSAWDYWVNEGVVSESVYPYAFAPCEHHVSGPKPACGASQPTPECKTSLLKNTKFYGASSYSLRTVSQIQTEIMTNGPVEGAFSVYADFPTYKSGVYQHVSGSMLGGHAIRILGWGIEDSTPYWLVANSWNEDWGAQGLFKILRGKDECGIEDGVVAGMPKVDSLGFA